MADEFSERYYQKAHHDGGICDLCHGSFSVGDKLWPIENDNPKKKQQYVHFDCAATEAGGIDRLRPPICKHWKKKGFCAFGDSCFFSHELTVSSVPLTPSSSQQNKSKVKKRKPVANDSRAFAFRAFLIDTFGLELMNQGSGVLDVGGGHGELAFQIVNLNKIKATVVDPRPLRLRRFARRASFGMYTKNLMFNKYNHSEYVAGCTIPAQQLVAPSHLRVLFQQYDSAATGRTRCKEDQNQNQGEMEGGVPLLEALVDGDSFSNALKEAENKAWTRKGLHEKDNGCHDEDEEEEDQQEEDKQKAEDVSKNVPKSPEEIIDEICEQLSTPPTEPVSFKHAHHIINDASLVVGLHPDQAASEIVAFASKFNKPFAVIPCCTYSREFPFRRLEENTSSSSAKLVTSYDDLVEWCLRNGPPGTKVATLDFEGKNKVVYWKPEFKSELKAVVDPSPSYSVTKYKEDTVLPLIHCEGSHYDLGVCLGKQAEYIFKTGILVSSDWTLVETYRNQFESSFNFMLESCRELIPKYMEELKGMSDILEHPFEEIFAWHCRVELFRLAQSKGLEVPEGFTDSGCTTVMFSSPQEALIAHNEDGSREHAPHCFLVKFTPSPDCVDSVGFMSFCYPLSIPGHTLAVNDFGVIQTINNVRILSDVVPSIPRIFWSRAVLDCASAELAVEKLSKPPVGCVGFSAYHHTIAQAGSSIYSVECGLIGVSVSPLEESSLQGHTNHLIHPSLNSINQNVTASSGSRQERLEVMIEARQKQWGGEGYGACDSKATNKSSPLFQLAREILHDTGNATLPIFRTQPDDPDAENTIATAIFSIPTSQSNTLLPSCTIFSEVNSSITYEFYQKV